jgi:hypothetical protein
MKIELTQTKDDLVSFYQFDRWYSDERKKYRIKTRLTWGAITTIPFWFIIFNADSGKVTSPIGLVIFGLFFFSLGFVGVKQTILSSIRGVANRIATDKNNSELMGPKTLEFTADKINWTSQWGQGQSGIETIKKIKTDDKYYYLYNTSFSAYVIPRTTFKTDDEVREFESVLKNYRQ